MYVCTYIPDSNVNLILDHTVAICTGYILHTILQRFKYVSLDKRYVNNDTIIGMMSHTPTFITNLD